MVVRTEESGEEVRFGLNKQSTEHTLELEGRVGGGLKKRRIIFS